MASRLMYSFIYAARGLRVAARGRNMRIHMASAVAAITTGTLLDISVEEWCVIILAIAEVLMAETLNTAIEALCDRMCPRHDSAIGRVKDLSAGAVLVIAAGAFLCGAMIFIPRFLS